MLEYSRGVKGISLATKNIFICLNFKSVFLIVGLQALQFSAFTLVTEILLQFSYNKISVSVVVVLFYL